MKNADQPAFARTTLSTSYADGSVGYDSSAAGLTKREYFAAMAMMGLLANGEKLKDMKGWADENDMPLMQVVPHFSIQYADELLKQLES